MVRLVDAAAVMRKLVYAATNPIQDRLVARVHLWPGVNGLLALLGRHPLYTTRPRHFFRPNGAMLEAVALNLVLPPELGDPQQFRDELRERVNAEEAAVAAERRRTGAGAMGRRAIQRPSWRDAPARRQPRRNLRRTIAARSPWARLEAILRNREFLAAYREARARWIAGDAICVPHRDLLAQAVRARSAGKLTPAVDHLAAVATRASCWRRRGVVHRARPCVPRPRE